MAKYGSGSMAIRAKKLDGFWYTPPNQLLCVTAVTPGTVAMRA